MKSVAFVDLRVAETAAPAVKAAADVTVDPVVKVGADATADRAVRADLVVDPVVKAAEIAINSALAGRVKVAVDNIAIVNRDAIAAISRRVNATTAEAINSRVVTDKVADATNKIAIKETDHVTNRIADRATSNNAVTDRARALRVADRTNVVRCRAVRPRTCKRRNRRALAKRFLDFSKSYSAGKSLKTFPYGAKVSAPARKSARPRLQFLHHKKLGAVARIVRHRPLQFPAMLFVEWTRLKIQGVQEPERAATLPGRAF